MISTRLFRAAPLGLAAALALSLTAAHAQAPALAPPGGGPPGPGMHRPDGPMRDHLRERMQHHRAERIADMTTVLNLSPTQAQALQAAMAPPNRGERGRPEGRTGEMATETTPQRLDHMQARMAEREARMRERLAAMRAFYASLTPDQQKSFDALGRLTHGGMHGRHAMHGGRGGRGMRHGPPPTPAGE